MRAAILYLFVLYAVPALAQRSAKGHAEPWPEWKAIQRMKTGDQRLFALDWYMRRRTGDSVVLGLCNHGDTSLVLKLNLNAENRLALHDFVAIPDFLLTDTLIMTQIMYQNYLWLVKKMGDNIFKSLPTKMGAYKHLLVFFRLAAKEKYFYADLEQRGDSTKIITADFVSNAYQVLEWDESKYLYPELYLTERADPVPGKTTLSVPDEVTIIGKLLDPMSLVGVDVPRKDTPGIIYYNYYDDSYPSLDSAKKDTLAQFVGNVIQFSAFDNRDSTDYYPKLAVEFTSSKDSVFQSCAFDTRKGPMPKKTMSTKEYVDVILGCLPRKSDHDIIDYKKAKTLFVSFVPESPAFWTYGREKGYYTYLAFFLYHKKLRHQRDVKRIYVRFNHPDGTKPTEFSDELDSAIFKEMYAWPFFSISGVGPGPFKYKK